MKTEEKNSSKNDKVTDLGFYILAGLMGISLVAAVSYLVYALLG